MMDFDADSAIDCIERAAREERIAGSNTCDADDPEPAREAIRRWYREALAAAE